MPTFKGDIPGLSSAFNEVTQAISEAGDELKQISQSAAEQAKELRKLEGQEARGERRIERLQGRDRLTPKQEAELKKLVQEQAKIADQAQERRLSLQKTQERIEDKRLIEQRLQLRDVQLKSSITNDFTTIAEGRISKLQIAAEGAMRFAKDPTTLARNAFNRFEASRLSGQLGAAGVNVAGKFSTLARGAALGAVGAAVFAGRAAIQFGRSETQAIQEAVALKSARDDFFAQQALYTGQTIDGAASLLKVRQAAEIEQESYIQSQAFRANTILRKGAQGALDATGLNKLGLQVNSMSRERLKKSEEIASNTAKLSIQASRLGRDPKDVLRQLSRRDVQRRVADQLKTQTSGISSIPGIGFATSLLDKTLGGGVINTALYRTLGLDNYMLIERGLSKIAAPFGGTDIDEITRQSKEDLQKNILDAEEVKRAENIKRRQLRPEKVVEDYERSFNLQSVERFNQSRFFNQQTF